MARSNFVLALDLVKYEIQGTFVQGWTLRGSNALMHERELNKRVIVYAEYNGDIS